MTAHTTAPIFPRRRFLWSSSAAVAVVASGLLGPDSTASASQLTKEQRDTLTPDEIVKRMLAGNERFATGAQKPRDFLAEQRATADAQSPAAIALTCVDSRTPLEVICDLGIGDTFNARVAGNVVNEDIVGSASSSPEFVDLVARTNVSMAVKQIQEQSPVLQELEKKGAIKIVGCMYDLGTARITLL
jgi:carbonic anhydrase